MSKDEQVTMDLVDITYVDLNKAKTRPVQGEIISPETITEQSGYIEPKRQIEDMIMAGRRLDEARKINTISSLKSLLMNLHMILRGRKISTFQTLHKCNLRLMNDSENRG